MIETVLGPIPQEQAGQTLMYEHVLLALPGYEHDPTGTHDRAAAFSAAERSLAEFRKAGGRSIVDVTDVSTGRDVIFLQDLARVSGVNIIASAGLPAEGRLPGHYNSLYATLYRGQTKWQTRLEIPGSHYLTGHEKAATYSQWRREIPGSWYPSAPGRSDFFTFLFLNELIHGLAAPGMIRVPQLAGAVTCACGADGVSQWEEVLIRGVAQAARRAGACVLTGHSRQADRQLQILQEEGLPPARVVVGHCDDRAVSDLARDRRLAERGAYVAYDHVGWEEPTDGLPDSERAKRVKHMVDDGFAERVILSSNAIASGAGRPGSRHGFDYLLRSFVPRLHAAGVGDSAIQTILVGNPARLLDRTQME